MALFLSPFPSLLGSLWIMQVAQVGFSSQLQQILVAVIACAVCAFAIFASRTPASPLPWMAIATVALLSLFLPLVLFDSTEPQRWLELGSFRFYVAALFLPIVVLLLTQTMQHQAQANWALFFCVLFGVCWPPNPTHHKLRPF